MQTSATRFRSFVLLIISVALLASPACSGDDGASAGHFVYKVDDGADPQDIELIRDVTVAAGRYYEKQLGRRLRGEVTIKVVLADSLSKAAFATKDTTFYLGNAKWSEGDYYYKSYLIAHELFHNFQWDIGDSKAFLIPAWFMEGAADYAAFNFLAARGDFEYEDQLLYSKAQMSKARLGDFVTVHQSEYALAFVAVDFLLRDRGMKALAAFYARLPTMEWRDSFHATFGLSVDSFIDEFEIEGRR